ncbi:MAG TPA: alpha/beta fold hydrolase [Solirubrobacter sp.]|nr:alpha/beta fold hydrolase [Solirubrobacter sp.]
MLALLVAGCGGSSDPHPAAPRLTGAARCGEATCATLRVPLDRSAARGPALDLQVVVQGPANAPVLVFLSGGPGEPGVSFLRRVRGWLGPEADRLRVVAFDQRGTGDDALQCPALQRQMGASDLSPPTAGAVRDCARALGPRRRFFTTADTVADLDALRRALHVDKLALDGVSYGTYTAQRYALAHPRHVRALVLDSVVPSGGVSLLSDAQMRATRRILGPVTTAALAKVVARRHDGPQLLDMLTTLSVGAPRDDGYVAAIRAAARGDDASLDRWLRGVGQAVHRWPAEQLSQGLHASTLCADSPAPWGGASAPAAGRAAALRRAADALPPSALYPFDRATAAGNGFALQCLYWPPVAVPSAPTAGRLPAVPTLLLNGDRDLSTPYEWARGAVRLAPRGTLMIVKGAGHDVQDQGDPKALAAVRRFVASPG